MTVDKKCIKCGHLASFADAPALGCPSCGAIYSKVEAAAQAGAALRPAAPPARAAAPTSEPMRVGLPPPAAPPMPVPPPAPAASRLTARSGPYIQQLRAQTNYPVFRKVIGAFFWFGVALGIFGLLVALFSGKAATLVGGGAASMVWLIFICLARETSLMLADLSDAATRMAELQERPAA